jgi:glycine hydroxymethyltransferase
MIVETLDGLAASNSGDNTAVEAAMRERVRGLCRQFPIYPTL